MADLVKIFWDPQGFELDALGAKSRAGDPSDGDTPYIRLPIRMLSIDTPETNFPGYANPEKNNEKLREVASWMEAGRYGLPRGLSAYLIPKLQTGQAGALHDAQGERAKQYFKDLLTEQLVRPTGRERSLFVLAPKQPFDSYHRLLAYLAPQYSKAELGTVEFAQRKTFNLLMLESGWAAPILIYPNLAKNRDLRLMRTGVKEAFEAKKGAWQDENLLLGYEFRACLRLWKAVQDLPSGQNYVSTKLWLDRYCASMTTLQIHEPADYFRVPVYDRVFVWAADVRQAVAELNLTAAP